MRIAAISFGLIVIAHAGPWSRMDTLRAEETPPATAPAPELPPDGDEAPRPDPFRLNIADLYLGVESDYEFRRVRSSSVRRRDSQQENRDFRLRETLGLATTGYVLDPNLFDFHAAAQFGLEQSRFKEKIDHFRQTDNDSGLVMRYDLGVDILKSKPVSFNAYARHYDNRIARRFLPSLHEIQTEAGASALILSGPVTTEVGYSYRDTERRGNRLEEDDESLTTNRFYIDSKWDISDDHHLRIGYNHEREENTYQGSLWEYKTTRDEIRLDHDLAFGSGHRLDTYMRYDMEKGDLARDEVEIVPRLTLQHTEQLKTIWRYGFYSYDLAAIDVSQHKFDGQALYTPNKEWRFSLDGFGLYEHVDRDIETQQYGGSGQVSYNRETLLGQLTADLNLGYDTAHTTGDAGRRYVRMEAHTLGGVRPVILRQRDVILSTIIAHDDKYRRVYVLGVDYLATVVADRVTINRIPWGRIAEGEVIYFDYQYRVSAEASVDSYRADFRIEHAFPFGLTPYYYLETRCQEVDRRSLGTPAYRDNQNRHRLGVRYGRQRWTVGTEAEIFDDSVLPYYAWHLTGQAALFRGKRHSLDVNSELSYYRFEDSSSNYYNYYGLGTYGDANYRRRVWFFDIDIKDRIEITDLLSFSGGAGFRREDDSVRGKTTGVDLECGLRYTKGYLTVALDVEYDMLSVVDNRENGLGVYLNVRRDLGHLLPAGGLR